MYAERGGATVLSTSPIISLAVAPILRFYEPPPAAATNALSNWTSITDVGHNARQAHLSAGALMHDATQFLQTLTIALAAAAVTTVLFHRFRQPVLLGYLLAGMLAGPHTATPCQA